MTKAFGAIRAGRATPQAPAGLGHSATITARVCDDLIAQSEERHAWLIRAGEQIRRWKAEDAANGQPWGEDQ